MRIQFGMLKYMFATTALFGCAREKPIEFTAARAPAASDGPQMAPALAVAPGGTITAAWVAATSRDSTPVIMIETGDNNAVTLRDSLGGVEARTEAPPKINYGRNGRLLLSYVVIAPRPDGRTPVVSLRFRQSADQGASWSNPVTITSDTIFDAPSFHDVLAGPDGTIYVSWLGPDTEHSPVNITHSSDGITWSAPVRVDMGEACGCCRTALAAGPGGTLYLAWRHVFTGNVRDVVVARSEDHGATWSNPVRVHADNWVIAGCPRAGPSMRVDSAGAVHVAWWTGKQGAAGVWYSRSTDSARNFSPPTAMGVAKFSRPAHVQLALGPGRDVSVVWDDGTVETPRIVLRRSTDGGAHFAGAQVLSDSGRDAGYPVIASTAHDIAVAWTVSNAAHNSSTDKPRADTAGSNSNAGAMHHHTSATAPRAVANTHVVIRHGSVQ